MSTISNSFSCGSLSISFYSTKMEPNNSLHNFYSNSIPNSTPISLSNKRSSKPKDSTVNQNRILSKLMPLLYKIPSVKKNITLSSSKINTLLISSNSKTSLILNPLLIMMTLTLLIQENSVMMMTLCPILLSVTSKKKPTKKSIFNLLTHKINSLNIKTKRILKILKNKRNLNFKKSSH